MTIRMELLITHSVANDVNIALGDPPSWNKLRCCVVIMQWVVSWCYKPLHFLGLHIALLARLRAYLMICKRYNNNSIRSFSSGTNRKLHIPIVWHSFLHQRLISHAKQATIHIKIQSRPTLFDKVNGTINNLILHHLQDLCTGTFVPLFRITISLAKQNFLPKKVKNKNTERFWISSHNKINLQTAPMIKKILNQIHYQVNLIDLFNERLTSTSHQRLCRTESTANYCMHFNDRCLLSCLVVCSWKGWYCIDIGDLG